MIKRVLMLFALATVSVAAVGSAQAGVTGNQRVSIAYAGFVPCANQGLGELVTGTINIHDLSASTTNGTTESWHFQFVADGALIGSVTGDVYRLAAVTHGSYVDSLGGNRSNLTYVNRYRLIGPGAGNNLVVRETAHITIDSDENVIVQHDELRIDCT